MVERFRCHGCSFRSLAPLVWRAKGGKRLGRRKLREQADAGRYLIQRGACAGTATTGRIVVDYAVLIGAEHALPRRSNCLGSPGDQIADRGNEAITSQRKGVAAFRSLSEDVIQQARLGGGVGTRTCAAHSQQGGRVAEIRIGHGISHGGGVDDANGGDGRGFVGALAGAKEVRNRDRRNDQNDSDDEQQLDQRTRCGFSWIPPEPSISHQSWMQHGFLSALGYRAG